MPDLKSTDRHDDLIIDEGFAVLNNFQHSGSTASSEIDTISEPLPRHRFASYASALMMTSDTQRKAFLSDCSLVFTARTKEDSESYSTGETFFLPCTMKPRCALEALAYTIFHAHVDGLKSETTDSGDVKSGDTLLYDPERSGAEWWTLVLDAKCSEDIVVSDPVVEVDDDEVGMHFDADYGLEAQLPNFMVHPRVATITYLSDVGIPTLILDKRSPAPSDIAKESLGGDISRAWLSHPRFGKHVAFDGRLLHGAPGDYFPAAAVVSKSDLDIAEPQAKKPKVNDDKIKFDNNLGGKRVTFLVNIWLNHCPIDADILDEDLVSELTTIWEDNAPENRKSCETYTQPFEWNLKNISVPDILDEGSTLTKATGRLDGPAGVEEDLIICNRHVTMKFGATMNDFHHASKLAVRTGSAEIIMGEGVLMLEVRHEATDDSGSEDS